MEHLCRAGGCSSQAVRKGVFVLARRLIWALWVLAIVCPASAFGQTTRPGPSASSPPTAPDAQGINSSALNAGRGPQGKPKAQVVPTPPTLGPGQTTGGEIVDTDIPAPLIPSGAWARHTYTIPQCAQPPTIDGLLSDAAWKTALRARGFYRYGGGTPSAQQTETWVCADKTHLYFAFRCRDQHPNLIQASMTQRNGNLGHDDYVGMDIDSQGSRHGYSTFIVTARGALFEQLEGGTADNITWAGDWKAATQRTARGWTCEMSIPFALMRYPKGAKAFNLILYRQIGRETSLQSWPYMPPAGVNGSNEPQYLDTFGGIAPPVITPRPTFLPYTLATAGTGNSVREGLDIKYPLSTTLTGVGTIFPDFQTIEQDVTNINFSYNEKLLSDRRPFFAEGSDFLPAQDLFYSRRIQTVDGGLKVVGKQGDTSIGVLATGSRGQDSQSASVVNVRQDLGLYSYVAGNLADSIQHGLASNQVAKLEGVYGWQAGPTRYLLQADHLPSWQGGKIAGGKDFFQFRNRPTQGHPGFSLNYQDIGPRFTSNLGFNPELDLRGTAANFYQYNQFDRGWLEGYNVGSSLSAYQHHTGGFFHNDFDNYANIYTRKGLSFDLEYDIGRRNQLNSDSNQLDHFHDHVLTTGFGWAQKTLYQQGNISENVGRQGGQPYNFLTLSQGVLVSRPFSVQLNLSRLALGTTKSTQAIATGTYRLSEARTLGARVVSQAGADQGAGLGTNIYFSFSQQVRQGTDLFLLFGDPNSPRTRGKFTLKIVHPF